MITLLSATHNDLNTVLQYVRSYHEFEGLTLSDEQRAAAVDELVNSHDLGRVFLIQLDDTSIGYIAICFGFSIEFSGRDAFIDEMFIVPSYRGLGYGNQALKCVKQELRPLHVRALHLEVDRNNRTAKRLYRRAGFEERDKYHLMSLHLIEKQ